MTLKHLFAFITTIALNHQLLAPYKHKPLADLRDRASQEPAPTPYVYTPHLDIRDKMTLENAYKSQKSIYSPIALIFIREYWTAVNAVYSSISSLRGSVIEGELYIAPYLEFFKRNFYFIFWDLKRSLDLKKVADITPCESTKAFNAEDIHKVLDLADKKLNYFASIDPSESLSIEHVNEVCAFVKLSLVQSLKSLLSAENSWCLQQFSNDSDRTDPYLYEQNYPSPW